MTQQAQMWAGGRTRPHTDCRRRLALRPFHSHTLSLPPTPHPSRSQPLAYGTCIETATCYDDNSCRLQNGNVGLRSDQCFENKFYSSLEAVFTTGTHTVLLLVSSHIGCGGRLVNGCTTWGGASFRIMASARRGAWQMAAFGALGALAWQMAAFGALVSPMTLPSRRALAVACPPPSAPKLYTPPRAPTACSYGPTKREWRVLRAPAARHPDPGWRSKVPAHRAPLSPQLPSTPAISCVPATC
jgi:hypothetical protein